MILKFFVCFFVSDVHTCPNDLETNGICVFHKIQSQDFISCIAKAEMEIC